MGDLKEMILKIFIVFFLGLAIFLGVLANTVRQHDIGQRTLLDRAIEQVGGRVAQQVREIFVEVRPYLDTLAGSEELHSREVSFAPGLLHAPNDDLLVWRNQWDEIPWLSPDKINAIDTLLWEDVPASRRRSINFSGTGMTLTIFIDIPYRAPNTRAWLGLSYRDTVVFLDNHVVSTEVLDDDWYLSTISIVHVNASTPIIIWALVLITLSLVGTGVLIFWKVTGQSY